MDTPKPTTPLQATDDARNALGNLRALTVLMNPDGEDIGTSERSSLASLLYRELEMLEASFQVLKQAVDAQRARSH